MREGGSFAFSKNVDSTIKKKENDSRFSLSYEFLVLTGRKTTESCLFVFFLYCIISSVVFKCAPFILKARKSCLGCIKSFAISTFGRMIKCLLTDFGQAGWENIWPSVMMQGPHCTWSVCHDLEEIFSRPIIPLIQ